MLRAIGWEVHTVYEQGIEREKRDEILVAFARAMGCVFITFDDLRGAAGVAVGREVKRRGGKVIVIGGGPDQPPERALGRLLFHWPEWHPFLEKHDGRVNISDTKHSAKLLPRSKMQAEIRPTGHPAFDRYLVERVQARTRPSTRRRVRKPNPTQSEMELGNHGTIGA
jgi:hypothetical protein